VGVRRAVAGGGVGLNASCFWDADGECAVSWWLGGCAAVHVESDKPLCLSPPCPRVPPHTRPTPHAPTLVKADLLLAFKAALEDPSGALESWQPGSNPCGVGRPWVGVTCDPDGWVVGVALDGRRLKGQLTGLLANVTRMREIHLACNQLFGE